MVATATRKSTKKAHLNPDDTRERRLQIMSSLEEGERVFCKGVHKFGTYTGIQDLPMPAAWILFDEKNHEEPVNPLELVKQPVWKKGDKVIHDILGKGLVSEVTGLCTVVNFEGNEKFCAINHSGNAFSFLRVDSEPSYPKVSEKTTLEELLEGSARIVPSPMVESLEGANNWISLFSGHSLNPDECEVSWIKAPSQPINPFEIPDDLNGDALSREDVEKLIERIVETSESMKSLALFAKNFTRYALVVIDSREGYKVYECDSMSAFLEKNYSLFKRAYSSLQKEWQAGRLEYDLGLKIGTLPETQARELYPLRDNLENCLEAWEKACKIAESENRKVKSSDVGAAVREVAKLPPPPKKIKTKCTWVQRPNAARYYRVKLFESVEVNLHDTYDAAARMIIDFAEARKQAPEELIVQGLLGALGELLGVSNAGAVAAAVDFLKKETAT